MCISNNDKAMNEQVEVNLRTCSISGFNFLCNESL